MIKEILLTVLAVCALSMIFTNLIVSCGERTNDPTRLVQKCETDGGTAQVEGLRFNKTVICNGPEYVLWVQSTNIQEGTN